MVDSEEDTLSEMDVEDEFLKKFEQDLMDLDEDEFFKEFEMALEEPVQLREYETNSNAQNTSVESAAIQDDFAMSDSEDLLGFESDFAMSDTEDLLGVEQENVEQESMENDIDAMLKAAMGVSDIEEEQTYEDDGADTDLDFGFDFGMDSEPEREEISEDGELLDILAGMSDEDSDLTEIGNLLKAHDNNERISLDDIDSIEDLESLGLGDAVMLDENGNIQEAPNENGKKKKKKKKEKKPKKSKEDKKSGGFLSKMSTTLFGEEDDDIASSETEESDEKKAQKKEKKAKKKQEKKEKKEQKKLLKQEKKEKKKQEKANKPKKEKKLEDPTEKKKSLPKKPVFLIFFLVTSLVVLIYLGTDLVGYTVNMTQSESKYDYGEYVEAYELLRGMKIKEVHKEFYDKTRLTAYVKKELESYEAYIARKMYPEALDALICAVGKYDKHGEEAASVGAGAEFGSMFGDIEEALNQKFGVTIEEARDVYRQQSRTEYTVLLYDLLARAGITE